MVTGQRIEPRRASLMITNQQTVRSYMATVTFSICQYSDTLNTVRKKVESNVFLLLWILEVHSSLSAYMEANMRNTVDEYSEETV